MADRVLAILSVLTVVLLGVTAGAMLTEAAILVPYWQSVTPEVFFDWYGGNAPRLVDFYSPLEVGSAVAALACAILASSTSRPGARSWWLATVLSLLVIATFFIYFQDVNAAFAERAIAADALSDTLRTWGQWQWGRVALGLGAFAASIMALRRAASSA